MSRRQLGILLSLGEGSHTGNLQGECMSLGTEMQTVDSRACCIQVHACTFWTTHACLTHIILLFPTPPPSPSGGLLPYLQSQTDGLAVAWSADAAGVKRFEVKIGDGAFQNMDLAHGSAVNVSVVSIDEVCL